MKKILKKTILLLSAIIFSLFTISSCKEETQTFNVQDVINALKMFDNQSPYSYVNEYQEEYSRKKYEFSYDEGTKKFYISYFERYSQSYIRTTTNLSISFIWGYLSDADVDYSYFYSNNDDGYSYNLTNIDFTINRIPNVTINNYFITVTYGNPSSSTLLSSEITLKILMTNCLDFANTFCTSKVDGSMSIR